MHAIKPCRLLWLTSNNFMSWRVCEFVMQLGASVVYIITPLMSHQGTYFLIKKLA